MLIHEVLKIKKLIDYCDESKVFFRENQNIQAEELFAYLAFKIGVMFETILFYVTFAHIN